MTESTESKEAYPEEANHTHKVTMTVYSAEENNMISIKIKYDPDVEGKSIEELGYLPAAYQFVEEYILPAIEEGYMDWEAGPLLNMASPSKRSN